MVQPDDIKKLIEDGMPGTPRVQVAGDDGTHFEAVVVSEDFEGKSIVDRHRMVYDTLGERMGGEIHALSLRTLTPDQASGARA